MELIEYLNRATVAQQRISGFGAYASSRKLHRFARQLRLCKTLSAISGETKNEP
jgi:hypothetical protein